MSTIKITNNLSLEFIQSLNLSIDEIDDGSFTDIDMKLDIGEIIKEQNPRSKCKICKPDDYESCGFCGIHGDGEVIRFYRSISDSNIIYGLHFNDLQESMFEVCNSYKVIGDIKKDGVAFSIWNDKVRFDYINGWYNQ